MKFFGDNFSPDLTRTLDHLSAEINTFFLVNTFGDEVAAQLFSYGLDEGQMNQKLDEFAKLGKFRSLYIPQFAELNRDQNYYPTFKQTLLRAIDHEEPGATPQPDHNEPKMDEQPPGQNQGLQHNLNQMLEEDDDDDFGAALQRDPALGHEQKGGQPMNNFLKDDSDDQIANEFLNMGGNGKNGVAEKPKKSPFSGGLEAFDDEEEDEFDQQPAIMPPIEEKVVLPDQYNDPQDRFLQAAPLGRQDHQHSQSSFGGSRPPQFDAIEPKNVKSSFGGPGMGIDRFDPINEESDHDPSISSNERQMRLIQQKEKEILEEKRLRKEEEERLEEQRKREREERLRKQKEEEEEYEEESEEEEQEDPKQGYIRYLHRPDPKASTFQRMATDKEKGEDSLQNTLLNTNTANTNKKQSSQLSHRSSHDHHSNGVHVGKSVIIGKNLHSESELKLGKGIGSPGKLDGGGAFRTTTEQPMELYRHPLKRPVHNPKRESYRLGNSNISNMSEREKRFVDELRKENVELKKELATLKNTSDMATIDRIYSDNDKLKQDNRTLLTRLKKAEEHISALEKGASEGNKKDLDKLKDFYESEIENLKNFQKESQHKIEELEKDNSRKDFHIKKIESELRQMQSRQTNDPTELNSSKAAVEELTHQLRKKDNEILGLEEDLQRLRHNKLGLEKENNALRVQNIQRRRNDLEVQKLRAEVQRLRNIASEFKDQAQFYSKMRASGPGGNLPVADKAHQRVGLGPNQPSSRVLRSPAGPGNGYTDNLVGYLSDNVQRREVMARAKGVLYEDDNLLIKVRGKPKKLANKDKIFFKLDFQFENKNGVKEIRDLHQKFSGSSGKH